MANTTSTLDDCEIVRRVLGGNSELFAVLVRRYHGPLLRLASSQLGARDAAEDAVQETFLSAFRSLASYKPEFAFRTWLWTILLNHCRKRSQRRIRQSTISQDASQLNHQASQDTSAWPQHSAEKREQSHLVEQLIARLPPLQAEAIRLRFYAGLTYPEISQIMGCSLSSAKNRVRWGLEKMSRALKDC